MSEFGWIIAWIAVAPVACLWLYGRSGRIREDGDQCGTCGYAVRGLPSSICPECGSDLLKVGYRRPGFWSGMLPGRRRGIVTMGWCVWAALGLLLWAPYQQYLAPGEIRRYESYRESIAGSDHAFMMWRTSPFTCNGWMDWGTQKGAAPFDGLELCLSPEYVYVVSSRFDPEQEKSDGIGATSTGIQYSVRTGRFQLWLDGSRETGFTSSLTEAVRKFCEAAANADRALKNEALEAAAAKLLAIPPFSPAKYPSGVPGEWTPYFYGHVLFATGLLAFTVPVLIFARRVV